MQLRAVHHAEICGGFSRAAEELFLTQPAISRTRSSKPKEEDHIRLPNRQRKQVRPTPAGERLLAITGRLFDPRQQAHDLLSASRGRRAGTLRIVAASAHHLLGILGTFRAARSRRSRSAWTPARPGR